MGEERKYSVKDTSRKIGIKLLDRTQIESTMPDFENIIRNIENIRSRASQQSPFISQDFYHLMYDNIIGIFGGRGSGKTSILYSLREQLSRNNKQDIILPVISPELIPEDNSMLMWILAMFEDRIEELNHYLENHTDLLATIQERFLNGSSNSACSYRYQSLDHHFSLKQEYQTLRQNCSTERGFREMRGYDYDDVLQIQNINASTQYQLMKRLNQFWNLISYVRKEQNGGACQPLIFIIIDDIDLAPERSMELLLSAYKYFSNANVVIILSAAMKMLRQVLTCRMYEKVVGSNFPSLIQGNELIGRKAEMEVYHLDQADEDAIEYMNKVIPQSSRYFLERFDTLDRKQFFRYPIDWKDRYDPQENHSMLLNQFLSESLESSGLLEPLLPGEKKRNNFFLGETNQFAKEYYLLFGNKSRYIGNGCLAILSSMESLCALKQELAQVCAGAEENPSLPIPNKEKYLVSIHAVLHHLLSTLISSHTRELENCTTWIPELLHYKSGRHYLFIHYTNLLEQYQRSAREIKAQISQSCYKASKVMESQEFEEWKNDRIRDELVVLRKKISTLFVMLNLLEHFTSVLAPYYYRLLGQPGRTRSIHGSQQLMTFLNLDIFAPGTSHNMNLFPQLESAQEMIHTYVDVLDKPERFLFLSIWDQNHVSDYFSFLSGQPKLWNMLSIPKLGSQAPVSAARTCREHPDWMRAVCTMLYLSKSGIQIVDQSFFTWILLFCNDLAVIPGLQNIGDFCRYIIQTYLDRWNLKKQADLHEEKIKSFLRKRKVVKAGQYTWGDFRGIISRIKLSNEIADQLITSYLHKNKRKYETALNEVYHLAISNMVTDLHAKCVQALSSWPVTLYVSSENLEEVDSILMLLSDALDSNNAQLKDILSVLHNPERQDKDGGYKLPFYPIYTLICWIKNYMASDWTSFANESVLEYAISRWELLPSLLEVRPIPEKSQELSGMLSDLLTLFSLLPYYFSAQFSMKNENQYAEFRIYSKKYNDDGQFKESELVAKKYADFLYIFSKEWQNIADYDLLRKMMLETKLIYIQEIFSKLGVAK